MSTPFHVVPQPSTSAFNDAYLKSQLQKWDITKHSKYYVVRFGKYYHKMQAQEFTTDLFNDPSFQDVFEVLLKKGGWLPVKEPVTKLDVEVVPASLTRMDLFDKLSTAQPQIIRPTGDIAKCMEDVRDGFQVSDMLREALLSEDSENAELYTDEEKSELLWRIFEHLCLGGACCQFEDKLEPYVEAAKKVYKELLSVQKNAATGKIEVTSAVYRVKSFQTQSGTIDLFPCHSRNSFCYVTVDPMRRIAKVWYHAYVPFW